MFPLALGPVTPIVTVQHQTAFVTTETPMTAVINSTLGSSFLFVSSGHLSFQCPPKRRPGTRVQFGFYLDFHSCLSDVLGGGLV